MSKAKKSKKISRVSLVLGLMILASGLFLTTKAVERIQDNRSDAASSPHCSVVGYGGRVNGKSLCLNSNNTGKGTILKKCVASTRRSTWVQVKNCASSGQECILDGSANALLGSAHCGVAAKPTATPTPKKNSTYHYYDPYTKTCGSSSKYGSLTDCGYEHFGRCFTTLSSCKSSYSKCTSKGGSCINIMNTKCTGTTLSGLCPGNTAIKCCVK